MTTPAEQFQHALREHLGNVVFGMDTVIHGLCLGLVAGGHVLLQGVPGIGKTLLAKTLAARLGGVFKRVQGTADLMPSDITGVHVYNGEERRFQFMPGPLFAEVLLVDEINRTGPKTQSALLQAMEEGCVTVDRKTYPLPEGFLVIATQNPHDFEGTFPLPESQLDRFLLRLDVAYPDPAMEQRVLQAYGVPQGGHAQSGSAPPLPKSALAEVRAQVAAVHVSDAVYRYVI
ncbi:MAG: AAA family ATPase, partial [Gammaproteobacteria bacterium]|nr:AAA family ATPase [Gammaproteobacteria bacterium]